MIRRFSNCSRILSELTTQDCWTRLEEIKHRVVGSEWSLLDDGLSAYHAKQYYITLQSVLKNNTMAFMNASKTVDGKLSQFQKELDEKFRKGLPVFPGYEFIYCTPMSSENELSFDGYDNHESISEFDQNLMKYTRDFFRRRMWTGGDIRFSRRDSGLHYGDAIRLVEKVKRMRYMGSDPLARSFKSFVDYERLFLDEETNSVISSELRRIVFLNDTFHEKEYVPETIDNEADFETKVTPSHVSNMRVSSLTFNSHKIHYDRDYATNVEKYPDLVVEGPLLVGLLLQSFHDNFGEHEMAQFTYKIMAPVMVNEEIRLCIKEMGPTNWSLWIDNGLDKNILKGKLKCYSKE
ncbi:unnamed protein product [Kuraishia capsulata CBS 1993]|uniref:MaoC-like domain-containing protein n=1 Tax=Kuraishia capsulata CBS 1993 TaxID=1382522 RepID=W6MLH5_9ASCO|nr:uncharacterized protein KUCA_T00003337001 [Kuraishia capsulata CBS 1993]CDK27359.1 unnamed protein product [Kuraishia capsulata CBS 1993]